MTTEVTLRRELQAAIRRGVIYLGWRDQHKQRADRAEDELLAHREEARALLANQYDPKDWSRDVLSFLREIAAERSS